MANTGIVARTETFSEPSNGHGSVGGGLGQKKK